MRFFPFIILFIMLFASTEMTYAQEKRLVGWVENVKVSPGNLLFKAKIDTGAKNSSLNAYNIVKFIRNSEDWVRFDVVDREGNKSTLEKKIFRIAKIKRHRTESHERFSILLGICLADVYKEVEVNLTDRSNFNYQVLIGRSFLKNHFIVDPAVSLTVKPKCGGK